MLSRALTSPSGTAAELRLLERAEPEAALRLARGEAAAVEAEPAGRDPQRQQRDQRESKKAARKKTVRRERQADPHQRLPRPERDLGGERAVGIGLRAQPLDDEAAPLEPRRPSRTGPAAGRRRARRWRAPAPRRRSARR